jgi:dethiobiotin synthetase
MKIHSTISHYLRENHFYVMDSLPKTEDSTEDNLLGLTILGTEFGCGKTVLITGLAALLNEQGFQAEAIKPVVCGPQQAWQTELSFISTITHMPLDYQPIVFRPGVGMDRNSWRKATHAKRRSSKLTLVETPGSCGTPLIFEEQLTNAQGSAWQDSCDLALEIGFPCILVAKHNEELLEKLSVCSQFIKAKALELIGLITVEVTEGEGGKLEELLTRTQIELLLLGKTQIPYLGCIKYSPSISVPHVKQGNLIKSTSAGLELLGMIKALNLKVPLT